MGTVIMWMEAALFVAVDAFTCALFLWKPFIGPDGKEAHWMW